MTTFLVIALVVLTLILGFVFGACFSGGKEHDEILDDHQARNN